MEKELHELRQKVKDQDALQQGTHSKRSITSSVVKEKASGPPARVESGMIITVYYYEYVRNGNMIGILCEYVNS